MARFAERDADGLLEASYEYDVFNLPDKEELRGRLLELHRVRQAQIMNDPSGDYEIGTVLAINNVVESWFLSLREHGREDDLVALNPIKRLFYENADDDRAFLRWLGKVSPSSSTMQVARDELFRQLQGKISAESAIPSESHRSREIIKEVEREQRALIERIITHNAPDDPQAVYRQLLATLDSRNTRRKLVRAWDRIAAPHLVSLSEALWDEMPSSKSKSFESLLSVASATDLVARFFRSAQRDAAALCAALDSEADVYADLPFLLRAQLLQPTAAPILTVAEGMRIAELTLARLAGVSMNVLASDESRWVLQLSSGSSELAQVNVRFAGIRRFRNNYTQPLRNRIQLRSGEATARSVISCEFSRDSHSRPAMTFQNVVSLLHELGHAIQHGWVKDAPVNLAGLESVPSELSETVSLFLEKGAFSTELPRVISRPDLERQIAKSRRVNAVTQRVTARERGLSASLAVALHNRDRKTFDARRQEVSLDLSGTSGEFLRGLVEIATDESLASPWRYIVGGVESAYALRAGMNAAELLRNSRPLLDGVDDYFTFYRAQSQFLHGADFAMEEGPERS